MDANQRNINVGIGMKKMKQTWHISSKILYIIPLILTKYFVTFVPFLLRENALSKIMFLNRFPSNATLKEKWIQALVTLNNQKDASNFAKAGKICALHFSDDSIGRRDHS